MSKQQRDAKDYKKAFVPRAFSAPSENDNDSHAKNKCYVLTNEHSAASIGFITAKESNNCPYMLRKRFRFVDSWIILKFSEETIFISGRNLGKLYSDICRHKVTNVFIANYDDEENSEDPYVDYIELKLNSDSEAKLDELPKRPKQ